MTFAVATSSSGAGILYGNSTTATLSHPTLPSRRTTLHIVSAAKKFSSRSKRIIPTTTTTTTTTTDQELQRPPDIKPFNPDEYNLKPFTGKLPGTEPDIWEGPHMNIVGFIGDYIWILGGAFAVSIHLLYFPFQLSYFFYCCLSFYFLVFFLKEDILSLSHKH